MARRFSQKKRRAPPAAAAHVAEGAVDHARDELPAGDEERVDGDQLTSPVRGGHFGDVDRNRHGGNA